MTASIDLTCNGGLAAVVVFKVGVSGWLVAVEGSIAKICNCAAKAAMPLFRNDGSFSLAASADLMAEAGVRGKSRACLISAMLGGFDANGEGGGALSSVKQTSVADRVCRRTSLSFRNLMLSAESVCTVALSRRPDEADLGISGNGAVGGGLSGDETLHIIAGKLC